jgi:hypothetical protein
MSDPWPGLPREEVEELAANYTLTIERVRELADERYPDDQNEAHQLYERATNNVRNALLADLRERGCPPEEMEDWLTTVLQAAAKRANQDNDSC